MKEELITFETAKLAKKKGFKIKTWFNYTIYVENLPTQSLLQRWIREVHNIHINIGIELNADGINKWWYLVHNMNKDEGIIFDYDEELPLYDTYEETLEKGLYEALNLIK